MNHLRLTLLKSLVLITSCLASVTHGQLPPVVESSATAIGSSGNAAVSKPAGTVPGDLLVFGITLEKGSDATITPPAGWMLIRRTNNGTDAGLATYYKIAGATEPTNYTFNLTGQKWAAGISRITGFNTLNPINVSGGRTGNSGNVTAPSVTTTTANALVLAFYTNKKGATYTPSINTTERYDAPNGPGGAPSNMMADFLQAAPGETGDKTATPTQTDKWAAQQVAISANDGFPSYGLLSINSLETGGCQICYQGLPGLTYKVEYADELLSSETVWNSLENQTTDSSGRVIIDDTSAVSARFYRAVLMP